MSAAVTAALAPLFAAAGDTEVRRWHLVYGGPRPLLIAAGCSPAAQWRCLNFFCGAAVALAAAGRACLGGAALRPRYVDGAGIGPAVWPVGRELGAVTGAVQLGTAGPLQKAAVLLLDGTGRPMALSKVAIGAAADAMIDAEAQNLAHVAALNTLGGSVPCPLDHGTTGGGRRFLVTDLAPSRRAGRRFTALHRRFLAVLGRARPHQGAYDEAAGVLRVAAALLRLNPVLPRPLHRLLTTAAAECQDRLAAWRGPLVMAHGDFAPWNLRRGAAGLYAFDWEYGRPGADPAHDVFHFLLTPRALGRRALDAAVMRRAGAAVQDFLEEAYPRWRWTAGTVAALALLYLLDIVLFYGTADGFVDQRHPVIANYLRMIEGRGLWMP